MDQRVRISKMKMKWRESQERTDKCLCMQAVLAGSGMLDL